MRETSNLGRLGGYLGGSSWRLSVVFDLHDFASPQRRLVSNDPGKSVGNGFIHVDRRMPAFDDGADEFVRQEGMRIGVSRLNSHRPRQLLKMIWLSKRLDGNIAFRIAIRIND